MNAPDLRWLLDRLPMTFTYREALTHGLTKHGIYALRDRGLVETIARGLYRRADAEPAVNLDLLELARRVPNGTLCLTTALVHHDLSDANPGRIDLAVASGSHRPETSAPVAWHVFDPKTFDLGRQTMAVDAETSIGIYSPERCIIDAFRLRYREGDELAYVAIRRWLRRRGSSPARLVELAHAFPRTLPVITKTLEIIQYA